MKGYRLTRLGKLEVFPGYDKVFDEHREEVEEIERKLNAYRREMEKSINAKIEFKDMGKEGIITI